VLEDVLVAAGLSAGLSAAAGLSALSAEPLDGVFFSASLAFLRDSDG